MIDEAKYRGLWLKARAWEKKPTPMPVRDRILALMGDGRERTGEDIATALGLKKQTAVMTVFHLRRDGLMTGDGADGCMIYRLAE